jgi:hypothetical protein
MRMKIFASKEKAKPQLRKYKGLKLAAVRLLNVQLTKPPIEQNSSQRVNRCTRAN